MTATNQDSGYIMYIANRMSTRGALFDIVAVVPISISSVSSYISSLPTHPNLSIYLPCVYYIFSLNCPFPE